MPFSYLGVREIYLLGASVEHMKMHNIYVLHTFNKKTTFHLVADESLYKKLYSETLYAIKETLLPLL